MIDNIDEGNSHCNLNQIVYCYYFLLVLKYKVKVITKTMILSVVSQDDLDYLKPRLNLFTFFASSGHGAALNSMRFASSASASPSMVRLEPMKI